MSTTPQVPQTSLGDAGATTSALHLSTLIYGVWRLADDPDTATAEHALAKIDACLEVGITSFDHADIYGGYACEELFGSALDLRPGLRDQIQLITKCDICLVGSARPGHRVKHYDTSADHIRSSVERSLRNLRTEQIDLLLLHRPDPLMQPDETAHALAQLCSEGKVAHLGVSNFTPRQTDLLASRLNRPIVCNQIELHPLHTTPLIDGTLDHCQQHRIRPMAWSPFAGGRLFTATDDHTLRVRAALEQIGQEIGASGTDQTALAWLLRHPAGVLPVLGTQKLARIADAAGACDLEMNRQQWFVIYEAALGTEVP